MLSAREYSLVRRKRESEDLSEKGQGLPIGCPMSPNNGLDNDSIMVVVHLFSSLRHHGYYRPNMGSLSTKLRLKIL